MEGQIIFYKGDTKKFTKNNVFYRFSAVIDGYINLDDIYDDMNNVKINTIKECKEQQLQVVDIKETGTYIIKNGYILHKESEECFSKGIRTLLIRTDEEALNKGIQATIELQK